jgi:tetratricopeptide (TPR) repeat protein
MRLFSLIVVAAFLTGACATRTVSSEAVAELTRAEQLANAGCYTCLVEAFAIYERQLQTSRRPSAAVLQAAFETVLFIVLREKELGIPADPSLEKARALAARLALSAPSAPPALSPAAFVHLADLAPIEPTGLDPDVYAQRNARERRALLTVLRNALDNTRPQTLLTAYLKVSLDCDDREARQRIDAKALLAQHGNASALRFRLALCALGDSQAFSTIREADSRWTEVTFFLGRRAATGRRPNLRAAIDLFNIAVTAFPRSPAIRLALAHAERGYGDLEPALASYDKVIAMVPTNREALLGRVITLSYLDRHREAIETATRMIELGTWLMGDAFYWRARNGYLLKSLDDAWSDAENAVKLAANTNVFTLAGVIAYDRKELDTAKDRFQRARDTDPGNCTAHSYFALVHAAQNNWSKATPVFSIAMTCFVRAAAEARRDLAEIEASDYDPVFKGRVAADHQKSIRESELKAAQAGYNAAQGFLRAGKRAEAASHLQIALEHPDVRDQAETLRKLIGVH